MAIVESIQNQLDTGKYRVFGVFVDLKKVSDTVDHNILLANLDSYGIKGVAKNWFDSCSNNLKQFLTLNRARSRTAATSKMDPFVIVINAWRPLTIITKSFFLDVAAVLDPPLLNGSDSSLKPVSTGVPRGSVLGPLFFLVYIDDLDKCVKYSKFYHFTDDTNMLQSDNSPKNVANGCILILRIYQNILPKHS